MDTQIRTAFTTLSATPINLGHWERVIRNAQVAARMDQWVLSLAGCREALAIAKHLVATPPPGRADDCVAALVVSHHNLADLQIEAGSPDLAAIQLCLAHEALMSMLQLQSQHGSTAAHVELQHAAFRHSRETHAALLRFLSEHGAHPAIYQALHAGCLALFAGDAAARPTCH